MSQLSSIQQAFLNRFKDNMSPLGFYYNKYGFDAQTLYRSVALGDQYIHVSFGGYDQRLRIFIHIGISCHAVEDLLAQIAGEPYKEGEPRVGTLGTDISIFLIEQKGEWVVEAENDVQHVVDEITYVLKRFCLSSLSRFSTINDVLQALSNLRQDVTVEPLRSPIDLSRAKRAVIASYLTGNKEIFKDVVERERLFMKSKGEEEFNSLSLLIKKLEELQNNNNR